MHTDGPYKISCNDGRVFLKAIPSSKGGFVSVLGTTDIQEASSFYIYHTDDESHPNEFQIIWKGDAQSVDTSFADVKGEPQTVRYLMAPVSFFGQNEGPLRLESYGLLSQGIFSLNSVLIRSFFEGNENIPTKAWLNGSESCLIRCTRRRWCFDGFLAVKRVRLLGQNVNREQQQQEVYLTCCEGKPHRRDNGNVFMAFRLLKKSLWADSEPTIDHSCAAVTSSTDTQAISTVSSTTEQL